MVQINLNESYEFPVISKYAKENDFEIEEIGKNSIGQNFLILEHPYREKTLSFMLDGRIGKSYIYKCIYIF